MEIINNRTELLNTALFVNFIALTQANKEKGYILRNGKMPLYEERNGTNGYNSRLSITLRKYLEGMFDVDSNNSRKNFIVEKYRNNFEFDINFSNREKYVYGSSPFVDSLIYKTIGRRATSSRNALLTLGNNNSHRLEVKIQGHDPSYKFIAEIDSEELIVDFFDQLDSELKNKPEEDRASYIARVKSFSSDCFRKMFTNGLLKNQRDIGDYNPVPNPVKKVDTKTAIDTIQAQSRTARNTSSDSVNPEYYHAIRAKMIELRESCVGLDDLRIYEILKLHLPDIPNIQRSNWETMRRVL